MTPVIPNLNGISHWARIGKPFLIPLTVVTNFLPHHG